MLNAGPSCPSPPDHNDNAEHKKAEHVLLVSIDGFHQFDLTNYIAAHPTSALARLVYRGTQYARDLVTSVGLVSRDIGDDDGRLPGVDRDLL